MKKFLTQSALEAFLKSYFIFMAALMDGCVENRILEWMNFELTDAFQ